MNGQTKTTVDHFIDVLKGALAAALVAALISFINYLGAHIGAIPTVLSMLVGGVSGVKVS